MSAATLAPLPRVFRLRLPPDLGLVVLTILILGVSGGMLWTVGLNYDGLTGSAPQKVHPSTYLCIAMLAAAMLRAGNPVAHLARMSVLRPASLFLAASGIGLFLHIAVRSAPGMAGTVDTFVLPGLFMMLLVDSGPERLRRLETAVHAVMIVNGLLAVVEFALHQRFFPYRLDGAVFETDTRSAALQGHPLANATVTACYAVALMAGGGSLPPLVRLAVIGVQLAALVAFGGRSAIVLTTVLGGGCALLALHRTLSRGKVPLLAAAAAAVALPLAALGLGILATGGFFDALLGRFEADGGSANARVAMFDLFGRLPFRDLLFGPDTTLVESLRRITGLEWGIENPIIRTLLYQGALMTGLLTLAVCLFLREVGRLCRRGVALPMLAFAVLSNTFESLGGKSTLLAKFAILLIALYRPLPGATRDDRSA